MDSLPERYSRCIPILGERELERIHGSTIAMVGLGGVGTHSAQLLAPLGPKSLVLIDHDIVEPTNLSRQVLYTEQDLMAPKALVAAKALSNVNTEVDVLAKPVLLDDANVDECLSGADLVLDCTDNHAARLTIARWCWEKRVPWVYAGAIGQEAMVSTLLPNLSPCFCCWAKKPEIELSCAQRGVLATTCALASSVQVNEVIKILTDKKPLYSGRLFYGDLESGQFTSNALSAREGCELCGGQTVSKKK